MIPVSRASALQDIQPFHIITPPLGGDLGHAQPFARKLRLPRSTPS